MIKLPNILAAVAMVILTAGCGREPSDAQPEIKTTDELMRYFSEEAVNIAEKSFQIKLDYSPQSIEQVESVLSKLHDEYRERKSDEGVEGLAMAFGAYIGECIRREVPTAKWNRDHPVGGEKSYPLSWLGGDSFPCAWCYRRITEGPEDNVWHKYSMLKKERTEQDGPAPTGTGQ